MEEADLRLQIASLFFRQAGKPVWKEVADDAEAIYLWIKQGTQIGPASARVAAPISGDTEKDGPGSAPGQAAQRNQTSRNNPSGRA